MTRAAARPTGCSSAASFGFAAGARARARTCATSASRHLYLSPSFQARAGSTHGYDVVDPTRDLGRARRRGGVPRAGGAAREAGLGDRARHRPEPHGDRRREPLLGRPGAARAVLRHRPARPAGTGASSTSTTSPACAQEDPEVFATTHELVARARARGRRRRAADRPSRRARRPGRLPRAAARRAASSTCGSRRSSTPASALRDWPVEGTVGYEFLNDVAALFVDPAGEARADRRCAPS